MNNSISPIESHADVENVRIAALLHEQMQYPSQRTPLKEERAKSDRGDDIMITSFKFELNCLMAEKEIAFTCKELKQKSKTRVKILWSTCFSTVAAPSHTK